MKAKQLTRTWISGITLSIFFLLCSPNCFGEKAGVLTETKREPGVIPIESMMQYGKLERPKVLFPHDLHTRALVIQSGDCLSCHLKEKEYLSLTFKRSPGRDEQMPDKAALMEIYHANCVGCHRERAAKNEKTGPVTCGQCHVKGGIPTIDVDPMGFDRSLHYRHAKASENKCENCHHEYDAAKKELVYVKGSEGTCRYCHKAADEENRISFQKAAHMSCIACHQQKQAAGLSTGPVNCRGCHDKAEKEKIKTVDPVPRMERKQPDTVFVKRFDSDKTQQISPQDAPLASDYRMLLVPYDHKMHEAASTTCRVCHHAAMTPCAGCHLLRGADADNSVNLEQAMHQTNTATSCMGCHDIQKNDINCRGCHQIMANTQFKTAERCNICHLGHIADDMDEPALSAFINNNQKAKQLLDKRQMPNTYLSEADIPETVIIETLEDQYHPVSLPHEKIVQTLLSNIKDNRLAAVFHKGSKNTCKACHHNSPEAVKPPRCSSCHGQPFNSKNIHMPGLMGAYHQQCMGCHKSMAIEKPVSTDCTDCHQEKKKR